jgi:hypothetical protein
VADNPRKAARGATGQEAERLRAENWRLSAPAEE